MRMRDRWFKPGRAALGALGCGLSLVGAHAATSVSPTASAPEPLSFDAAWQRVKTGSDRLAAARAAVDSKAEIGQGLQGLGGPSVSLSGAAFAYSASLTLDLDPVTQGLTQVGQALPAPLQRLVPPSVAAGLLSKLPDRYASRKEDTAATASISALWPLYMGGASQAVRGLVAAQQGEAQADADKTEHELATLLVQRYFGAQLAQRAATLRQQALATIAQHDQAAERLMQAGLIARVERLQAKVQLEDARRQALKSQDDAQLAMLALGRTVKATGSVWPSNPLFVLSQPIEPVGVFIDAAEQHHPGLAKVAAKKAQAEQLHEAGQALSRPQVVGFAQRALKSDHPDWVAGVAVRWTLWESLDKDAMSRASLKQIEQAEFTDRQARSDIALLVEKQWNALEQSRRQYLAAQASVELAREVLKLRQAGLREGTSTTLDLIDAELHVLKVQTERSQMAHDYDVALALLLESCGLSEEFGAYLARADVRIP